MGRAPGKGGPGLAVPGILKKSTSSAPPVVSALCLGTAGPGPVSLCLQCDQFVSQYEPVLIEVLVEVMEPTFVCSVSSAGAAGSRAVSRGQGECWSLGGLL